MADELLDLVNEKDEVIGEIWKSEANQNPKLIHREAAVVIYDDSGRILFQKRSKLKKVHPGLWSVTAAGHIGSGEEASDAAHRELSEEVGFDTDLEYYDKTLNKLPTETHFTYWFIGRFPAKAKIRVQTDEVETTAFLLPKDLKEKRNTEKLYGPMNFDKYSKLMTLKIWKKIGVR